MVSRQISALISWLILIVLMGSVVGVQRVTAEGDPFFDDFSDMDIDDDMPVRWAAGGSSVLDATSGDLAVTSSPPRGAAFPYGSLKLRYQDVSIRTQLRILQGELSSGIGFFVGAFARSSGGLAYSSGIAPTGEIAIILAIGANGYFDDVVLASAMTGLDPVNSDIQLRFDVFGDTLALTVWADGTSQPATP